MLLPLFSTSYLIAKTSAKYEKLLDFFDICDYEKN